MAILISILARQIVEARADVCIYRDAHEASWPQILSWLLEWRFKEVNKLRLYSNTNLFNFCFKVSLIV